MEVVLPLPGSPRSLPQGSQLCPVFRLPEAIKANQSRHAGMGWKLAAASCALMSYIDGFMIFHFCCACDNFQRKVLQGFWVPEPQGRMAAGATCMPAQWGRPPFRLLHESAETRLSPPYYHAGHAVRVFISLIK